jgi:hypothetical protein
MNLFIQYNIWKNDYIIILIRFISISSLSRLSYNKQNYRSLNRILNNQQPNFVAEAFGGEQVLKNSNFYKSFLANFEDHANISIFIMRSAYTIFYSVRF